MDFPKGVMSHTSTSKTTSQGTKQAGKIKLGLVLLSSLLLVACGGSYKDQIEDGTVEVYEREEFTDKGTPLNCAYFVFETPDDTGRDLIGVDCEWVQTTTSTTTTTTTTTTAPTTTEYN